MLRSKTEPNNVSWDPPQRRRCGEDPHQQRRNGLPGTTECAPDDAVLDEQLHALRHAGWPFSTPLHHGEFGSSDPSLSQGSGEDVGRGNCILNREVDTNATHRRHCVRRVTDAEQAQPPPCSKTVHRDSQQLHVIPRLDRIDPVGAPSSVTAISAASRSVECRPSAATTRSARISVGPSGHADQSGR